jgi:hypothetical protein
LREKMVPGSPFSLRRLFTAPFSQSEHHQGGECAEITSYKYKTARSKRSNHAQGTTI